MLRLLFFKGRSWKPPVGDWKPYLKYRFIYSILKKVEPYYPCDRWLIRGYQSWGNMVLHSLVFVKWFPVDDECCAPFSALASECNVHDTSVEVTSCRRQERTVFCKMETFPLAFLKDSYAFSDWTREEQVRSDWIQGKQRVLFPRGPQCFPWSQLLGVLLCFANQVEQIAKKIFVWRPLSHKFAAVSRCTTWLLHVESSRSPPIEKRTWAGGYSIHFKTLLSRL